MKETAAPQLCSDLVLAIFCTGDDEVAGMAPIDLQYHTVMGTPADLLRAALQRADVDVLATAIKDAVGILAPGHRVHGAVVRGQHGAEHACAGPHLHTAVLASGGDCRACRACEQLQGSDLNVCVRTSSRRAGAVVAST